MLVGKNLTETDAIGAQLTLEYLVGGDFELGIYRTSTRTRNSLERGVSLKGMVEGSCELEISDACELLRYLRNGLGEEIDTGLRQVHLVHLKVPGWFGETLYPTTDGEADVTLLSRCTQMTDRDLIVSATEVGLDADTPLEILERRSETS